MNGPIHALRVLDAETGQDIPSAWVNFETDRTNRIDEIEACQLRARLPSAHKADYISLDILGREFLTRRRDQLFAMPMKLQIGYRTLPISAHLDYAPGFGPISYPRARIEVRSDRTSGHEYYWTALTYTTKSHPVPGWNATATCADLGVVAQAARCELGPDGVLRFHLHRIPTGEQAESRRTGTYLSGE